MSDTRHVKSLRDIRCHVENEEVMMFILISSHWTSSAAFLHSESTEGFYIVLCIVQLIREIHRLFLYRQV